MVAVIDGATTDELDSLAEFDFPRSAVVAVLLGGALAWTAHLGAVELLVAVAVVQALLAVAWVFGLRQPGRIGALVIAALAAGGADAAVSVWPHSHLGTLLALVGLAVPVMFVHQLLRGAARVRIVESLGGIALLVVAEVSLPALVQLRHEFADSQLGGKVVVGVVAAAGGALAIGFVADLASATPRFDSEVPRGLLAVIASALGGAALGYFALHDAAGFAGGRGAFAGAAVGALVALLAVAMAFIEHAGRHGGATFAHRARSVLDVVFPVSLMAPVAFLLCLAIRT